MAIFDAMLEFSDNQTVTATAVADNSLDLQAAGLEMGAGEPVYLNVKVGDTAFTTGGDEDGTLTVALVYDTVSPIDTSSTVIYQTTALNELTLTAGTWILRMALPVDVDKGRYVGLLYTTANDITAGSINAYLDHGPQSSYDTQVATSNI